MTPLEWPSTSCWKHCSCDGHRVLFLPVHGDGPAVPAGRYRQPLARGLTGLTCLQGSATEATLSHLGVCYPFEVERNAHFYNKF